LNRTTKLKNKLPREGGKLSSIETIERSFKLIRQIQHPKKTYLRIDFSLPIFPNHKIIENEYNHIFFTRSLIRECSKLSHLQFPSKQAIKIHSKELLLRVIKANRFNWYSLYIHQNQSNGKQINFNWIGEFELRSVRCKKRSYLLIENEYEVTWGKIDYRKTLLKKDLDDLNEKSSGNTKKLRNFPRYVHVTTIFSEQTNLDFSLK